MKTSWLLMLAGVLAGVSGDTAVAHFVAEPTTTRAGQFPGFGVSFVPTTRLVGGDTITITVAATVPSTPMVRVFDTLVGGVQSAATVSVGFCTVSTAVSTPENPSTTPPTPNSIAITLAPSTCALDAGRTVAFHIPDFQWTYWNPNVGTVVWLQMSTTKDVTGSAYSKYAASSGMTLTSLSLSTNADGSTPDLAMGFVTTPALHSGDVLTVSAYNLYPLFQASALGAPFGAIGNCTANRATSIVPVTTAPTLNSRIWITLGPTGCAIPENTDTHFTIPSSFVSSLDAANLQLSTGNIVGLELATNEGQWASASFVIGAAVATAAEYRSVTWGGVVPSTYVAGQQAESVAITFTPTTALSGIAGAQTVADTITIGVLRNWFLLDGAVAAITTDQASCASGVTSSPFSDNYLIITLNPSCALAAGTPVTLTLRAGGKFEFNPAGGTVLTFSIVTSQDRQQLYNQVGYTTVAECGVVPNYIPGNVSDIGDLSVAEQTWLASQIGLLNWGNDYMQSCTTDTETTTFVKYTKSMPGPNNYVNVAHPGTPPVAVSYWGPIESVPMEAVVRSYPPTAASLQALGINPTPPVQMHLAWLIAVDRMTNYGHLQEEALFGMRVAAPGTAAVMFFENAGDVGIPLMAQNADGIPSGIGEFSTTWYNTAPLLNVASTRVSAFAGYVPAASPSPKEDESDDAWFGFLVFILLPLLSCSASLLFLLKRKPKTPPPPPMEPAPVVMYQQPYPTITEAFFPKDLVPLAPLSEIPPPPAIHNPVFTSSFLTGAVPAPSPTFYP